MLLPVRHATLCGVERGGKMVQFGYKLGDCVGPPVDSEKRSEWVATAMSHLRYLFGHQTLPPEGRMYATLGAPLLHLKGHGVDQEDAWRATVDELSA